MGLLDGKVAIITGAGGGLGRSHALLFAKEGAKLVVNDLDGAENVAREILAAGGQAKSHEKSIATAEGAESLVRTAVDAFGKVDVLVSNAGILRDKTLLKMDEAMWDAVVTVHMKGTFLCGQSAARQMIAQGSISGSGGGRIINTTSVSGMLGNFGQANYAAAKAGIYGLTRTMSIELQKHRITVNAIAPIAKTRMTEDLPMFQGISSMTPEHVSPAVLFLASDLCGERTGYVLGSAGARMYAFQVVETAGKFKDEGAGIWTAQEINEHWDAIVKG